MAKISLIIAALVSALAANPSSALIVGVDGLVGIKESVTVFNDNFGGSPPPPAGPFGANTYAVSSSAPLVETSTMLTMDSANGVITTNALGQLRRAQTVTVLTPASPSGLGISDNFEIGAGFQFIQPVGPTFNGYSIRLTDGFGSQGSYITQLQVFYDAATNQSVIGLMLQDFVTNQLILKDFTALSAAPIGTDTIALWLTHSAGSTDIFGSYWFIDEDTNTVTKNTFAVASTMFQTGNYVRAQLQVFESVPEPGTLFLVGLGLAGFLLRQRAQTLRSVRSH